MERRFLTLPQPAQLEASHRTLTIRPHPPGSTRNFELAQWTAERFKEAGLQEVGSVSHDVWLPVPREVAVEIAGPVPWRAATEEPALTEDADTQLGPSDRQPAFHAYSASGAVTASVVYAGHGHPADYDWLRAQGIDVAGKIVLVRYSSPYSYRGFKALTAEQRGAAAVLMFADPEDDGSARGAPYPHGPWRPDTAIARGSIAYDFLAPGDPLTPGWASLAGAPRLSPADAPALPAIISVPIAAADATTLLEALGGPVAPSDWQGGLPIEYRAGPGPPNVDVRVRIDTAIAPVWTVTGLLRGSEQPEQLIIVGNHRDAWGHGGVDPSSGSAALVELARCFGALARQGWRPRRSILFASWDAEELALTSSTEWAEQHQRRLGDSAVAYLNVDGAASGSQFVAAASPSLRSLVAEAARAVRDPTAGIPVAAVARARLESATGEPLNQPDAFVDDRLGGGSDYTPFLNHLGIPIADLAFGGPHGVYHTRYDTHAWVSRHGDPGFRYHRALVQIWGIAALRLASADVLPLDPMATASSIAALVRDLEQSLRWRTQSRSDAAMRDLVAAVDALARAAAAFDLARAAALERNDRIALSQINRRLVQFERAFLDPAGLDGRPWYRHLIHAPAFSYQPEGLPGLQDAIRGGDERRWVAEVGRLVAALQRAAAQLRAIAT